MADPKELGVGMLGYSFMGKAHTNAYKKLPYIYYPPPAIPVLKGICGRNETKPRLWKALSVMGMSMEPRIGRN